jgi:putative transcriptional regulator
MNELKERIAGEITLSESPGSAMKKWRELFGISQVELSKYLKIATSTISDYESNRRLSPGVGVIKRFVDSLFTMDETRGGNVLRSLLNLSPEKTQSEPFYKIKDFSTPISGADFNRIIEGKIVANLNYLDNVNLFGYTALDSLRVILEISPQEYPKLFGSTNERAFIFENVSTGRSPMVVIRVAPIKPRLIVIQGLSSIDKLAIKLAQVEKIPLILTKLDVKEIAARLDKV